VGFFIYVWLNIIRIVFVVIDGTSFAFIAIMLFTLISPCVIGFFITEVSFVIIIVAKFLLLVTIIIELWLFWLVI